jgi:hypothetical protein
MQGKDGIPRTSTTCKADAIVAVVLGQDGLRAECGGERAVRLTGTPRSTAVQLALLEHDPGARADLAPHSGESAWPGTGRNVQDPGRYAGGRRDSYACPHCLLHGRAAGGGPGG